MTSNGRSSEADPAAAAAAASPAAHLVWFRPGDLRLADHEPLHTAAICLQSQLASRGQAAGQPAPLLLPFFCLDERQLAAAPHSLLGLPQLGPHRLRWVALLLSMFLSMFCTLRSCTFLATWPAQLCSARSLSMECAPSSFSRISHQCPTLRAGCCWRRAPA